MGYPTLSLSVEVPDADAGVQFYASAFGAQEVYRLTDPRSGRVAHVELTVGDSLLMLAEAGRERGELAERGGVSAVKLCLSCADVDSVTKRAVAAGAEVVRPLKEEFYGHRCGALRDPFGHEWMVFQELERVEPAEMQRRWNALYQ